MAWWRVRIATSTEVRLGLRMARTDGGFTLLELLIVMAVLGILAGIVVFSLQGRRGALRRWRPASRTLQRQPKPSPPTRPRWAATPGGPDRPPSRTRTRAQLPDSLPAQRQTEMNAARAGGELLASGATSPNLGGTRQRGPLAQRGAGEPRQLHASGSPTTEAGMVQVLDAAGQVPAGATHTAKDCSAVSAGGPTTRQRTRRPRQRPRRLPHHNDYHRSANDDDNHHRSPEPPTTTTTTIAPTTTTTSLPHTTRPPDSPATMEPPSATASSAPSR